MKKWLFLFLLYFITLASHSAPLPAAEAFPLEVKKIDPNTFVLEWHIKPGYFLYSERIKLTSEMDDIVHLGALRFPPSEQKTNKQGQAFQVYRNTLSVPVPILGVKPGETLLHVSFQGCSDEGFCYPPETHSLQVSIDTHLALSKVILEQESAQKESVIQSESDDISKIFMSHNWAMILLIFYGLGLLLAFTPCLLPMVPVLSGIIVGHGDGVTTKKAFFLSLSYVLSMSVTYAVFGAVAALLGANLQISMQSPWAISLFSLIFILLALSMFGFYEFKLPHSWQSKIAGTTQTQRGGHYLGAAIMGCLSTLILSPCVTAPLIGVLSYIAQTQNILLGSVTLFVLSLGMGTPLLLIGTSAGKWLPETGSWMNTVKAFFGILLIAVAIYLMSRILPAELVMLLWACLLIFSGIYAGALTPSLTHQEKLMQSVGIILLGYGFLILVGFSMGATNPLHPLIRTDTESTPTAVGTLSNQSLERIQQEIAQTSTPIMLDFYADWCASCKIMEATTLKNVTVKKMLHQFKVIKIDVTANTAENRAIMNYFKVVAPPTFLFFNSQGNELVPLKVTGEMDESRFLNRLKRVNES